MKNGFLVLICTFSLFSSFSYKNNSSKETPKVIIEEEKTMFIGFDNLLIGSVFEKSKFFKYFTTFNKPNDQVKDYSIDKLQISKEIGIVENVHVYTYGGKIYWVTFRTGIYCNYSKIDYKIIYDGANQDYSYKKIDRYYTPDKSIMISKEAVKVPTVKGDDFYFSDQYNYEYLNRNILGKIRNMKQQKINSKNKADYMKDMKQF